MCLLLRTSSIFGIVLLSFGLCGAYGQSATTEVVHRGWIGGTVGLGSQMEPQGSMESIVGSFHGTYQFGRNLVTMRSTASGSGTRFTEDWAVLYGRAIWPNDITRSQGLWSFGVGIAYVARRPSIRGYGSFRDAADASPGIALDAQFFVREFPEFFPGLLTLIFELIPIARVGFYGYANINPGENLWGGALGLQLGKFW